MSITSLDKPDNLQAEKIEVLKDLFPQAFSDGKLNLDALKEELGDLVDELPAGEEHYGLNWPGKRDAKKLATKPPTGTLKPVPGEGVNEDTTKNLIIEGDNLEVLRIMQKAYAGRIKMIYIDPPYNTGNDFVYKDDFKEPVESYLRKSGQADEEGLLVANPKASGRFHSNWLNMMYPRLRLARNLLKEDGVIFVSIDDNEVLNFRALMDEIYGEENFIAQLIWEGANKNDAKQIGTVHEYVLVYARQRDSLPYSWELKKEGVESVLKEVERLKGKYGTDYDAASKDLAGWFRSMKAKPSFALRRFRNIDDRGAYKEDDPTAPGGRRFELKHPQSGDAIPLRKNRGWSFSQEEFERLNSEGRISFVTEQSIMVRRYLHETDKITPPSVFYQPARSASERLSRLMGKQVFDYPKDETIISKFVEMSTNGKDDEIILDFFAGSGTTGEAVMKLNIEESSNRRFILVQLPEQTDVSGYPTIAAITKARLIKVSEALNNEAEGSTDIGFNVLSLTLSNFRKWTDFEGSDPQALGQLFESLQTPFVDGWTPEGVLTEIMLTEGFPLDSEVSQAEGFVGKVQQVKHPELDLTLLLCLDETLEKGVVQALTGLENTVFVCRESALTDALKLQLADVITVKTL